MKTKANESCERSIILAADNVVKLRQSDVMRVMEDYYFAHGSTQELVDYINENRPDLAQETRECQLELIPVETRFNVTLADLGHEGYEKTVVVCNRCQSEVKDGEKLCGFCECDDRNADRSNGQIDRIIK